MRLRASNNIEDSISIRDTPQKSPAVSESQSLRVSLRLSDSRTSSFGETRLVAFTSAPSWMRSLTRITTFTHYNLRLFFVRICCRFVNIFQLITYPTHYPHRDQIFFSLSGSVSQNWPTQAQLSIHLAASRLERAQELTPLMHRGRQRSARRGVRPKSSTLCWKVTWYVWNGMCGKLRGSGGNMCGAYLGDHEGYRDDFGADSIVLDEGNSMWPLSRKMSDRNGWVLDGYLLNLTASAPLQHLVNTYTSLVHTVWFPRMYGNDKNTPGSPKSNDHL